MKGTLKMICPNPDCLSITYISQVNGHTSKYVRCIKCGSIYTSGQN